MYIGEIAMGLLHESHINDTRPPLACKFASGMDLVVIAGDGRKYRFPSEQVAEYLDRVTAAAQAEEDGQTDTQPQPAKGGRAHQGKPDVRRRGER